MRKKLEQRYGHMAPPFWDDRGFHVGFVWADCHEPAHVHVTYRESKAKFWIDKPPVRLVGRRPNSRGDEAKMLAYVKNNREDLLEKWKVFCAGR
jgi:hypothetical protein